MKPTILVADDDKTLCDTIKTFFESKSFTVVTAHDGVEALKYIESHTPDIILLDVMMPGVDGFTVLEAITKTPALLERTVLMTNSDSMDNVARAMSMGAVRYVVKSDLSLDEIYSVAHSRLTPQGNKLE